MASIGRKGARRLPQISSSRGVPQAGVAPVGFPDPEQPPDYATVYYEIKELLRRVWQLENGNIDGAGTGHDYIIACTFNGVFGDSQVFIRHELRRAIQFAADFANSAARLAVGSEPTSSMAIDIQKSTNSGTTFASVGTMSYGAGNGNPALTSSGNAVVNFAVGDILLVIGPATHDATAGDIGITLMASRT